jgi:hypothetical protein
VVQVAWVILSLCELHPHRPSPQLAEQREVDAMSYLSSRSWRAGAWWAALACFGTLGACNQNQQQRIAEAELFKFSYVRLLPGANGQVTLRMNPDTVCRDYFFTETELADAVRAKQFQRGNVTLPFRFDTIGPCQATSEVRYAVPDLREPFTRPDGTPGLRRPHNQIGLADVVTELSSGGVLQVAVFGIKINGTTRSQTAAPGPVDITSAEVPAAKVGAASGLFAHANVNPNYAEVTLTNVLANPNRFTADFSFLAKSDAAGGELLLAWDGEMVLRLDIED